MRRRLFGLAVGLSTVALVAAYGLTERDRAPGAPVAGAPSPRSENVPAQAPDAARLDRDAAEASASPAEAARSVVKAEAPLDGRPRLCGTVLGPDGSALAGAEVALALWSDAGRRVLASARSEGSGRFQLELETDWAFLTGAPVVEIASAGLARVWVDGVTLPWCSTRDLGWVDVGRAAPVFGRVVDAVGRAVAGATIAVSPDRGAAKGTVVDLSATAAVADSDGAFVLEGLGAGSYFVLASAPGFARAAVPLQIARGEDVGRVRLALEPAAPFEAEVVDGDGTPVADAQVRVAYMGLLAASPRDRFLRWVGPAGTADSRGRIVRYDVAEGDWLVAWRPGFAHASMRAAACATPDAPRSRIVLERIADLAVRLEFEFSSPEAPVAEFVAQTLDSSWDLGWRPIGMDRARDLGGGRWLLAGLESEPFQVVARLADGRVSRSRFVWRGKNVPKELRGDEVELPVWDKPGGTVRLQRDGAPHSGSVVRLLRRRAGCGTNASALRQTPLGAPFSDSRSAEFEDVRRAGGDGRFASWTEEGTDAPSVETACGARVDEVSAVPSPGGGERVMHVSPAGSIRGRVRVDGQPPGFPVLVMGHASRETAWMGLSAYSAPDGSFRIAGLAPGRWALAARAGPDQRGAARDASCDWRLRLAGSGVQCNVSSGTETSADLELAAHPTVTIRGRALRDGVPAVGLSAELRAASAETSREIDFDDLPEGCARAVTDAGGRFLLESTGPGPHSLWLIGADLGARFEIDPDSSAAVERDFDLRTARLSGRIVDAAGRALSAKLEISPRAAIAGAYRTLDVGRGDFDLAGLSPGTYALRAWDPTGRHGAAEIESIEVLGGKRRDGVGLMLPDATSLTVSHAFTGSEEAVRSVTTWIIEAGARTTCRGASYDAARGEARFALRPDRKHQLGLRVQYARLVEASVSISVDGGPPAPLALTDAPDRGPLDDDTRTADIELPAGARDVLVSVRATVERASAPR